MEEFSRIKRKTMEGAKSFLMPEEIKRLKVGDTIVVDGLRVTTQIGFEVYHGCLEITRISEQGTPSKIIGRSRGMALTLEASSERNFHFTQKDTGWACSAPESALLKHKIKLSLRGASA